MVEDEPVIATLKHPAYDLHIVWCFYPWRYRGFGKHCTHEQILSGIVQ
jgi:hypothetical protein